MADDLALDHVDHVLGDIAGKIADAFQVTRYPQKVDQRVKPLDIRPREFERPNAYLWALGPFGARLRPFRKNPRRIFETAHMTFTFPDMEYRSLSLHARESG